MRKVLSKVILGLSLMGCSVGVLAEEIPRDKGENPVRLEQVTADEFLVFEDGIKANKATPRIDIVGGDNLTNYDYEKSFYVNKNNGPQLKIYMESYNDDFFTYKIKCNGLQVDSGTVMGNKSRTVYIKAQDAEYEIIINNSTNGNRMDGYLRVTQDK